MMKKILLITAGLLFLVGCSSTKKESKPEKKETAKIEQVVSKKAENYTSYLDKIDRSKVKTSDIELDLMIDIKNPKALEEENTNVFIARVISVDKAELRPNSLGNTFPYSVGKLEILKNLEGDAEGVVEFARLGGILEEKERAKNDFPEAIEKANYLREQSGKGPVETSNELVEVKANGDIYLSAGEVYLFYANWDSEWKKYTLNGFEYGALKLEDDKQPIEEVKTAENEIGKTWEVKNEGTGQQEDLGEYLEKIDVEVKEK